jgi:hypothetical protein
MFHEFGMLKFNVLIVDNRRSFILKSLGFLHCCDRKVRISTREFSMLIVSILIVHITYSLLFKSLHE